MYHLFRNPCHLCGNDRFGKGHAFQYYSGKALVAGKMNSSALNFELPFFHGGHNDGFRRTVQTSGILDPTQKGKGLLQPVICNQPFDVPIILLIHHVTSRAQDHFSLSFLHYPHSFQDMVIAFKRNNGGQH